MHSANARTRPIHHTLVVAVSLTALFGCSEQSNPVKVADTTKTPPAAPPAPVVPSVPASVIANSPTSLQASPGDTIKQRPSVIVKDAQGRPMSGIVVTFQQAHGAGTIRGSSAMTDSAGIATLQDWTIGPVPGLYEVLAGVTTGTLTRLVSFRAYVDIDPPSLLRPVQGNGQIGAPGASLPIRPAVRVYDAFKNPVAGRTVTFSVESGGGMITGATAISDASGLATLGSWTLGQSAHQSVSAKMTGSTSFTFSADAVTSSTGCPATAQLTVFQAMTSSLGSSSCQDSVGRYIALFSGTAIAGDAYEIGVTSSEFPASIELRNAAGTVLAFSGTASALGAKARFKAILPAGAFTVAVRSNQGGIGGQFIVGYDRVNGDPTTCEPTFMPLGATTSVMGIAAGDCVVSTMRVDDRFRVWIRGGTTVLVNLEDMSYDDHDFEMLDPTEKTIVGASQWGGGYDYVLTYTAPADGFYVIHIYGNPNGGQQYKLSLR